MTVLFQLTAVVSMEKTAAALLVPRRVRSLVMVAVNVLQKITVHPSNAAAKIQSKNAPHSHQMAKDKSWLRDTSFPKKRKATVMTTTWLMPIRTIQDVMQKDLGGVVVEKRKKNRSKYLKAAST